MNPMNKRLTLFLGTGAVLLFLWFLSAMFPAASVRAQALGTGTEPYKELDDKITLFFEGLISGNTDSALGNLLLQSPLGTTANSSSSTAMKTRLEEAKTLYGNFIDYELIKHLPVGKDVVLIRYILKCDNYPVAWTFTFYRKPPPRGSAPTMPVSWQLIEMRFDTNMELPAL